MSEMTHSGGSVTQRGNSLAEAPAGRYDRTPISLAWNSN
jgi:hypothetical protein